MEVIQAQLKAAEEEALAEEAAQQAAQMDIDAGSVRRELTMENIGEVEDRDEGEVDSQFKRSIKPIEMGNGEKEEKGKGKGKVRASSGMMSAMKAAARAMGLEGGDELDEGGGGGLAVGAGDTDHL